MNEKVRRTERKLRCTKAIEVAAKDDRKENFRAGKFAVATLRQRSERIIKLPHRGIGIIGLVIGSVDCIARGELTRVLPPSLPLSLSRLFLRVSTLVFHAFAPPPPAPLISRIRSSLPRFVSLRLTSSRLALAVTHARNHPADFYPSATFSSARSQFAPMTDVVYDRESPRETRRRKTTEEEEARHALFHLRTYPP